MTEIEIAERLCAIFAEYIPCPDEYQQWAVEVMPEYQKLLVGLGFMEYTILGGHPNDHWLDEILVRTPRGIELTVPDPEDAGTATPRHVFAEPRNEDEDPRLWDITDVVLFFSDFAEEVRKAVAKAAEQA